MIKYDVRTILNVKDITRHPTPEEIMSFIYKRIPELKDELFMDYENGDIGCIDKRYYIHYDPIHGILGIDFKIE